MNQLKGSVLELQKVSASVSSPKKISGNVGTKTMTVGEDGATFIPSVTEDGILSWTNDKDLPNPEPVNIKGKDGRDGVDGKDGYTPVLGKDYFTESQKEEFVDDVLQNALPSFYTEISRGKGQPNKVIRVTCHGLKDGETYSLHLYTSSRRRGSAQNPWRHPSNENDGENYTGKGYANLVGQRYSSYQENELYPDVPRWMPNNGILQTEWEFTAEKEKEVLEIEIGTWLLPMLKPIDGDFENDTYGLIGVSNRSIAPLLFQFRLVKDGTVGLCQNTLRIGLAKQRVLGAWQTGFIKYVASKKVPIIDTQYLYTSIQQ